MPDFMAKEGAAARDRLRTVLGARFTGPEMTNNTSEWMKARAELFHESGLSTGDVGGNQLGMLWGAVSILW